MLGKKQKLHNLGRILVSRHKSKKVFKFAVRANTLGPWSHFPMPFQRIILIGRWGNVEVLLRASPPRQALLKLAAVGPRPPGCLRSGRVISNAPPRAAQRKKKKQVEKVSAGRPRAGAEK